jgi:hypothetical protein
VLKLVGESKLMKASDALWENSSESPRLLHNESLTIGNNPWNIFGGRRSLEDVHSYYR